MRHRSLLPISLLSALTAAMVAAPAHASGVSLRLAGETAGAETRAFPFDNTFGLGLMRASFVFESGEHDVARIGHMVGLNAAHSWLTAPSPETYDYDFKHYPIAGQVYTAHKLVCEGPCELGIPAAPAGHLLVLAGLVFEAEDGNSRPLSTIAIEPDVDNGIIHVDFNDGSDFKYGATVQYSYVSEQDVVGGAVRTESGTSSNSWRVQFHWPDLNGSTSPVLLHGFRVHFTDGPLPLNRLQLLSTSNRATIYFADAGYNDSFEGSISVVPTTY